MSVEVPTYETFMEELAAIEARLQKLEATAMPEEVKQALTTMIEQAAVVLEWLTSQSGGS